MDTQIIIDSIVGIVTSITVHSLIDALARILGG